MVDLDPAVRDAYLRRLGAAVEPPSADALIRLHRAHVERIAWETLWIHLGEGWSIDPAAAARRLATGGRGGYCFHLNGGFSELLRSLGYRVAQHVGDVRLAAGDGTWATSNEADPALAVVATWVSPGVDDSAQELRNIGARPRTSDDESATFTTKNGGILRVIHGAAAESGDLAFEYDGDLEPLLHRLTGAGVEARISEGVLYVANPDAVGGSAPASIVVERSET